MLIKKLMVLSVRVNMPSLRQFLKKKNENKI